MIICNICAIILQSTSDVITFCPIIVLSTCDIGAQKVARKKWILAVAVSVIWPQLWCPSFKTKKLWSTQGIPVNASIKKSWAGCARSFRPPFSCTIMLSNAQSGFHCFSGLSCAACTGRTQGVACTTHHIRKSVGCLIAWLVVPCCQSPMVSPYYTWHLGYVYYI